MKKENKYPSQFYNNVEYYLYTGERYFSRGNKRMHVIVWETESKQKVPKGYHVHHIDENSFNNNYNNLELKAANRHLSEHSKSIHLNNPEWSAEFQNRGQQAAKEWHGSPEGLEWHKRHGKESWNNRAYIKLICKVCGKEYQTRKPSGSKFCHANCKAKALRDKKKGM